MIELRGFVRTVVENRKFGFIRVGKDDYFFHRDDYSGEFSDLVRDFRRARMGTIQVVFNPVHSDKGLRAANVQRSYVSDPVESDG